MSYEKIFDELYNNQDLLRERLYRLMIILPASETKRVKMAEEMELGFAVLHRFLRDKKDVSLNTAKRILVWIEKKEQQLNTKDSK